MKTFKTRLADVIRGQWTELIEARNEKDLKDIIYTRYGLRVAILWALI